MAHVQKMLQCLINPADPVRETSVVITAILSSYPVDQQDKILAGIEKEIQKARSEITTSLAAQIEKEKGEKR